ncbi:hypothetical protein DRQ33_02820 [bacterium]|nr:MAG: hypothetical protein DRQ33_02820 [bacterium]
MNTRNIVLLIIIVVGVLIYVATNTSLKTYSTADKSKYKKLFPSFDKSNITRIETKKFQSVSIIEKKNDSWMVVDSMDTIPADEKNVNNLLDDLDSLKIISLCSKSPKSHFKMKVDTLQGSRFILYENRDTVLDVIIGGMAGFGATYIRPSSSDSVFEAKGMLSRYSAITDWRDKTIVEVPIHQIKSFSCEYTEGSYTVESTDTGWLVIDNTTGQKFIGDSTKISTLLRPLADYRAATFPRLPDDTIGVDFSKPEYDIEITLKDGTKTGFSAYPMPKNENIFIVKSEQSPLLYKAYKGGLRRFVREELEQLKLVEVPIDKTADKKKLPPAPPKLPVKQPSGS